MFKSGIIGLFFVGLFTASVFAADGDIIKAEARADITRQRPHSITFYPRAKICKVVYNTLDVDNNIVGRRSPADFIQNIEDDPDTMEDETSTAYTALIANINNNNNFMISIKNRVEAGRQ